MLNFLDGFLPSPAEISGRYVEPFLGGGAVFLHLRPRRALLSDHNSDLIDVYKGIKHDPLGVWRRYVGFGSTKRDYFRIRDRDTATLAVVQRAARLLYLNRTCFKGNWRHNGSGRFNVGYGGQSRRWVITRAYLTAVSRALSRARLICDDFESVIEDCTSGDFIFVDPPYRPGERDLVHAHYKANSFRFGDHERLARTLTRATRRGVHWCLTTSAHPDVLRLFEGFRVENVPCRSESSATEAVVLSQGGGQ